MLPPGARPQVWPCDPAAPPAAGEREARAGRGGAGRPAHDRAGYWDHWGGGHRARSVGQVYARHMNFRSKGLKGVIYSYYFAKDQPHPFIKRGHRHDWEDVIV